MGVAASPWPKFGQNNQNTGRRRLVAGQAPTALISKVVTLVLCVTFVGLCICSFIQARKAREAAEAEEGGSIQEVASEE